MAGYGLLGDGGIRVVAARVFGLAIARRYRRLPVVAAPNAMCRGRAATGESGCRDDSLPLFGAITDLTTHARNRYICSGVTG